MNDDEDDDTPMEGVLYLRLDGRIVRCNVCVVAADGMPGEDDSSSRWRLMAITTSDVIHVRTARDDTA